MVRVKRGNKRRYKRKKMARYTKGFWGKRKNCYHMMRIAVMRAWVHAYEGRKLRKRDMRRLWQIRINARVRMFGFSYSRFMGELRKAHIRLNRKILAHLAVYDPDVYKHLIDMIKKNQKTAA